MRLLVYLAVGGALGTVARYLVAGAVQARMINAFPAGTLFVNVGGSLLLGFLVRYALETPAVTPEVRALMTPGLCGGFTTFSAFSYETVALLEAGDWKRAGWYFGLSLAGSLVGVVLGIVGARELLAWRRAV